MIARRSKIAILLSVCAVVGRARGDALVVTRAMRASTIAEIFVERTGVRVELEVGPADLVVFRDLLPDELFSELSEEDVSAAVRQERFTREGFVIQDQYDRPLVGKVERSEVRRRIVRDDVTGDPLIEQPDDAELVLSVRLKYELETLPEALTIRSPLQSGGESSAATIGFVCYHNGLPINDYRYLPSRATVHLDWSDPWYSRFEHPNLRRQFAAPLSVFLYVEAYEVRQEIVVRPKDLQQWIDLGLEEAKRIPVDRQDELKSRVVEFLSSRNPVSVDGEVVTGRLDRIHFIRRSLRTTGIIEPPEELDVTSATLGIIFVYPIDGLPDEVSMTWELFGPRIQTVPAVASDEAGGLPSQVTSDAPVLSWRNYLTNPSSPALTEIPPPPPEQRIVVPMLSAACTVVLVVLIFTLLRQNGAPAHSVRRTRRLAVVVAVAGLICWPVLRVPVSHPFAERPRLSEQAAQDLLGGLLHNVYRAFDHHDESVIYDRLAQSVDGELLSDVYVETRRSMEVRNQGGLRISVKDVTVQDLESAGDGAIQESTFRCRWRVSGWIGHWGHTHSRANEHVAVVTLAPRGDRWKITSIEMLDERPIEPDRAMSESVQVGGA